jgi:hypothetical protein
MERVDGRSEERWQQRCEVLAEANYVHLTAANYVHLTAAQKLLLVEARPFFENLHQAKRCPSGECDGDRQRGLPRLLASRVEH